jgi:hypothetical protein
MYAATLSTSRGSNPLLSIGWSPRLSRSFAKQTVDFLPSTVS